MKKQKTQLWQFVVATFLLFTTILAQASLPKFSIIPIVKAPHQLARGSVGVAQYLVVNNTSSMRTLTMVPIAGIRQNGGCNNPFTLGSGHGCLLILQLTASQMDAGGVHSGPVVCQTLGPQNNTFDPFLCSQPNPTNQLEVFITG